MNRSSVYDADLDWYLTQSASACGAHSGFGAFVAMLERGGAPTGGIPNDLPVDDMQVGWMRNTGHIKRERELGAAWRATGERERTLLLCRYLVRMPRENVGAREEDSTFDAWPKGVSPTFGDEAGIALYLAHENGQLGEVISLLGRGKRGGELVRFLAEAADGATRWAHDGWRVAKRGTSSRALQLRGMMTGGSAA
jgi:hypothetical protein